MFWPLILPLSQGRKHLPEIAGPHQLAEQARKLERDALSYKAMVWLIHPRFTLTAAHNVLLQCLFRQ